MTPSAAAHALRIRAMRRRIYQKLMKDCRADYEAGNRGSLADAIYHCSLLGMQLPSWAAVAWVRAYQDIVTLRIASWHELLANDHPLKAKALARERIKRKQREAVARYASRDVPIARDLDSGLFKMIADKTGLTPRQVRDLYYQLPSDLRTELRADLRRSRRSKQVL